MHDASEVQSGSHAKVEPAKNPECPSSGSFDVPGEDFAAVQEAEQREIQIRRSHAGVHPKAETVGLALSGGGIRSACFNMGIVQALQKAGLWRHIDYLATVSGGGYIGGLLSSKVMVSKKPATWEDSPLGDEKSGEAGVETRRLIHGGKYLYAPWQLANKYLAGLVFINLAVFSGLVALFALISFLWRGLDYPWVRDRLNLLELDRDLYAPFFPCFICLICWLIAWAVSYWKDDAEAPGHGARLCLRFAIASFLIGVAVLIGNGDISVGALAPLLGDETTNLRYLSTPVLALILAGLVPIFRPEALIRSGTEPDSVWKRYVFQMASTCMLAGLPILVIGALARENISGYNDSPARPVIKEDIEDWAALATLLTPTGASVNAQPLRFAPPSRIEKGLLPATNLTYLRTNFTSSFNHVFETIPMNSSNVWNAALPPALPLATNVAGVLRILSSKMLGSLSRMEKAEVDMGRYGPWKLWPWRDYLQRYYWFGGWLMNIDATNAPIRRYWDNKISAEQSQDLVCELLSRFMLTNAAFCKARLDNMAPAANFTEGKGEPRLRSLIAEASVAKIEQWPADQVAELNRLLLEETFPEIFRKRTEIRRRVAIFEDQKARLLWFGIALTIFLAGGAWVDLNAASLHRLYRNRLADHYLAKRPDPKTGFKLSELNTAEHGGPYHLILASVAWVMPWSWIFQSKESKAKERILSSQPQSDSFLLSRHYCGSKATRFVKTEEYETWIPGRMRRMDLAEAIALSGGAINPGQAPSALLFFLMFVLNLRLGQWHPNPRYGRRPKYRARFLPILMSRAFRLPERRPFCFLGDGGIHENLGFVELLMRRCRLIIVADASGDPHHQFRDLARAIRIARLDLGVRITNWRPDANTLGDTLDIADLELQSAPAPGGTGSKTPEGKAPAGTTRQHFVMARIHYPANQSEGLKAEEGLLVYLKPSFTGDEGVDLVSFRKRNPEFPHESTSDQLYAAPRIESYRRLGQHIGMKLCSLLPDLQAEAGSPEPQPPNQPDAPGPNLRARISEAYERMLGLSGAPTEQAILGRK